MVEWCGVNVNPAIQLPWRNGPAHPETVMLVTATRFTFTTHTAAARSIPRGLRFWASWDEVPGAVGLSMRFEPFARRAWTLTTWTNAEDLASFLRSPAHRSVVTAFRAHLAGTSHSWETGRFDLGECWRTGIAALN